MSIPLGRGIGTRNTQQEARKNNSFKSVADIEITFFIMRCGCHKES